VHRLVLGRSQGECLAFRSSFFIRIEILVGLAWISAAFAQPARADSLTDRLHSQPKANRRCGFTVVDFAWFGQ
jgi:hypothetical protein